MAARKSRAKTKAARPTTVAAYLASLTPEKRAVIEEARAFVHRHMPKGMRAHELGQTARHGEMLSPLPGAR